MGLFGSSGKCDMCRKRVDPLLEFRGKTVCESCKADLQEVDKPYKNASGYKGSGGQPTKPMGYNPNQKLSKRAERENEEWRQKHGKK